MAIFTDKPEEYATHPAYVNKLRVALRKVTTAPNQKFLYYKQYKFTDKPFPLLLVDFAPGAASALNHMTKATPTAEGHVILMPNEELSFDVVKGTMPKTQLKRYLASMSGMRTVYIDPADATGDDDGDGDGAAPAAATGSPATPAAAGAVNAAPKPLPGPPPADLIALAGSLRTTTLLPEWEAKKAGLLLTAAQLLKSGQHEQARKLLEGLATKRLPASANTTKPLPAQPGQPVAAVAMPAADAKARTDRAVADAADALSDLAASGAFAGDGLDTDDDTEADDDDASTTAQDPAVARKAALPPSVAVAAAQQRLAEEDEAFQRRKTVRKVEKIKMSTSQQALASREALEKAAAPAAAPKKLRDYLSFGKDKDKAKDKAKAATTSNRIDDAQENKKADDELKKYNQPFEATAGAGSADMWASKATGKMLDSGNQGDDIASAAGAVTEGAAAAVSSTMLALHEFNLYSKTTGAQRSVHLHNGVDALGALAGNLVSVTKGSVAIADHAGAAEAGSAVPILGIVAAVPALLAEINQVRSAMLRLIRQQKTHAQLEKTIESGDSAQATLYTLVSGFIERDGEAIAKNLARIFADLTKITGHAVAAGGITGPVGVALIGIAMAGKALVGGAASVQALVEAHDANGRRKKLQPTLHAMRDWKSLAKDAPAAPTTKAMTAALEGLDAVEKGTPQHQKALEAVRTAAAAYSAANARSPKQKDFADQVASLAKQEQASWAVSDDKADPLAKKKDGALGPQEAQHRDARKLMQNDPRLAAQTLLDQAQREGAPGGPAFQVLKSFGIKASQVYGKEQGDDKIASNREMRQKILFKLEADDETAMTLSQTADATKDSAKGFLSMRSKHRELANYMEAKDLLKHGGREKRGLDWQLKMDLLTDDVEEKKETLLGQVEYLETHNDIDPALAAKVKALLVPRKERKAMAAA